MTAQRFKGILFDFDGTLACTMNQHFVAWRTILQQYDIMVQPHEYFPYEGLRAEEVARHFFVSRKLPVPNLREIVERKERYYLSQRRFQLYPGVEDLVHRLKQRKVQMAIVTAGSRRQFTGSVPAVFLNLFNGVVAGDMTVRGKPHPDPYVKGAETLGLASSECIAVENAPLGIQSAKRADTYCIAICSTLDAAQLREADEIVETFAKLPTRPAIQDLLE